MRYDLPDTTAGDIAATLLAARRKAGMPMTGMVLTLIIVADESQAYDAQQSARQAAREHPSRILVVVPRPGKVPARLDAELQYNEEGQPGEAIVMRLFGDLASHADSVVLPLLLPDAPTLVWWAGPGPEVPALDPIGSLADRRVTDAAEDSDPNGVLLRQAAGYRPGDTDLAWSRITLWRTHLAALFDQPQPAIQGIEIASEQASPSANLLAAWLERGLQVPVSQVRSEGPGITSVRVHTAQGVLAILRPDGQVATIRRPDQADRTVSMAQRETPELLAEEMRRLDEDEIYGEVLAFNAQRQAGTP